MSDIKFYKEKGRVFIFSLLLVSLLFTLNVFSQGNHSGSLVSKGLYSFDEELPFWFYTNQRGRISKGTNTAVWISGKSLFQLNEKTSLEAGGGILFQDGIEDKLTIDELYAELNLDWLQVILGKKQQAQLYSGLSATNENILWSLNAQPLPGIQIATHRPIYINKERSVGVEASWNEYFMGNDRFVENTRLHHKNLYLIYNGNNNWHFKTGVQHFAQWSGTSPVFGKQPSSFKDYIRIVTGREGGSTATSGDQVNVLGNHLGSYELYVSKFYKNLKITFIYNSIFEDGSGSRLANFPDGRYGLHFSKQNSKSWVTDFLYELYYTKNQSQTVPQLYDMYFNNGVYRSGWTHKKRVMGLPFITTNYYDEYIGGDSPVRIGNNILLVHHIGLSGFVVGRKSYKLFLSYRNNYGHYYNRGYDGAEYYANDDLRGKNSVSRKVLSGYFELNVLDSFVDLNFLIGGDISENDRNLGLGIELQKQLF
ncbi:capsule assembly Wzi family protein [Salegentibacter sp. UBA1130]|uniref:capsule assembly Wzi family protein n=1 Tax=Salegentibacter sp. UBA1130 TaxID=1947451 RepID=UPI002579C786|nr:capsule assembly Wzi family protein [Salegentibacter sp. UBA1130]